MHNNSPVAKNQKLNLIQAFRGLAALLVVLFHATQISEAQFNYLFLNNFFIFGDSGVDLFFVLSGFIIFYIHRSDINVKTKFKSFILKRFVRIYPFYWLLTILALFSYFFVPALWDKTYTLTSLGGIIKSIFLIPQEQYPVVGVGWTLSYELLFYFMFSLLIFLRPKLSVPIVSGWLLLTLGLFFLETFSSFEATPFYLKFLFSRYNLEFIFGVIAAYLVYKIRFKIKVNQAFLVLNLGVILFALCCIFFKPGELLNIRIIAYGISSMLIILGAALIDLIAPLKIPTFLLHLGNASYSIYLTNKTLLRLLSGGALEVKLERAFGYFLTMSLIIVVTVALGCLVYSSVEKPLLEFSRKKLVKRYSQ